MHKEFFKSFLNFQGFEPLLLGKLLIANALKKYFSLLIGCLGIGLICPHDDTNYCVIFPSCWKVGIVNT